MLRGHGSNGDAQCGFTLTRMVALAGRRGRGDGGKAVGMIDLTVVLWLWGASTTEVCDGDGKHGSAR